MADHTPGPWTNTNPRFFSDREHVFAGTIMVADCCRLGQEESEANARLIAAAPDLLAAIEEHLAAKDWPKACEMMKAAVAKAKGGAR
jgi:hypothetical protein